MKFAILLVIFNIMLCISLAILQVTIPEFYHVYDVEGNNINEYTTLANTEGIEFEIIQDKLEIQYNNVSVNPNAVSDTSTGFFNSIFDVFGISFISRVQTFLDTALYGSVNLLIGLTQGLLGSAASLISVCLKIIISVGYLLTMVWLITGKNMSKESAQ